MTYKRRRPIQIDWDAYVRWMLNDPHFVSRYTRKGCLVIDKETGEAVYEIVYKERKNLL